MCNMRRFGMFGRLALLVVCAGLLVSCALPGDAAAVVKIGLIAPFEGLGRPLGYAVLPAVKAAIAEANASGELGPYRVALVALNDDLDPQTAATQARILAQDDAVLAVIGPWSAATAASAGATLSQAGLPTIVVAALEQPAAGVRSLCPAATELPSVVSASFSADPLRQVRFHPGDAASAADELLRLAAAGWQGTLIGGPDVARPWFIGRAGRAAEGTRAIVCRVEGTRPEGAAPGEHDVTPALAASLASAAARAVLGAAAQEIAGRGRPTRAGIAARLSAQPLAVGWDWVQVENGRWRWPR